MSELTPETKAFVLWLTDLRCPFSTHYNGTDSDQPRITFDKGSKNYTLEQVFEFWNET